MVEVGRRRLHPRKLSRRALLGSGGAVLALPWLEALSARPARGQSASGPRRFLPIFFPNGAPRYWWPEALEADNPLVLPSVLEPFAPLKDRLLVLGNIENHTPFNPDGSSSVEPSHGRLAGAFLTAANAGRIRQQLNVEDANGISADQVLAQIRAGDTLLDSLQVGLSTKNSYCDGQPCSLSRSISWASELMPLYKLIDPQQVFDKLFGAGMPGAPSSKSRDRSVIDSVLESSKALAPKLSSQDRQVLERYLTSLRELERKLGALSCRTAPTRPTFTARIGLYNGLEGYDRGTHFDVMNQLIALAFQCDITRVISFMLEDERSEFVLDNVEQRMFTPTSSTPGTGLPCPEWHGGGQSSSDVGNAWCTIQWWHNLKVVELCQALADVPEGDGNVLDNTVVLYGSCMHGANHSAADLPMALLASPKVLRTDRYLRFLPDASMRDLLFTLLNGVFGLELESFGESAAMLPNTLLEGVLA